MGIFILNLYKVHLFGIYDDALPCQVNYLIKESELVGKGADTVISLVHNYFELHGSGEKRLVIHADNCSGQNKNNADLFLVILNLALMGFFGLIKLLLRKSEVDNLDDLVKVVQNSTSGGFNIAQTIFDNNEKQVVHFYE
ncbi:chaperonin: PROVISIONAL [Gigaspora margarita]|uniref:Chaperonin: PROVISIONAL n=1 Tax=Gigaspora margarita TaxID=4874 RepID=A0A8H4ATJ1_GIGMA|nr:chaperonin: PROVISIONAL [Gigaspora margarita]